VTITETMAGKQYRGKKLANNCWRRGFKADLFFHKAFRIFSYRSFFMHWLRYAKEYLKFIITAIVEKR
jgi:hypothetical protein